MKKYPNLIRELEITTIEQVWVCDMTYICVGYGFNYLSLITDAYSKKIVGFHLHPYLTTEGCLQALNMALYSWSASRRLIHHSDRGSQYCSLDYVLTLREAGISISMTDNGDPYENAIAERVNGILKADFELNRIFKSHMEAKLAVHNSIHNYNTLRPHMSCNYLTPNQAHYSQEPLISKWKTKRTESKNVRYKN
jgi:transposase InsO family protein